MKDRNMNAATSVLIVGGSLNGLTMATLLARRRVPSLVVERHPRTSIQYKFRPRAPSRRQARRTTSVNDRPVR
jgi:putative polyketide hydroxylase